MSDVASLLSAARDAHRRFQIASGVIDKDGKIKTAPDDPAAASAVQDALDARTSAQALDPTHTSVAWAADQAANRGIPSASLVAFYTDYLA